MLILLIFAFVAGALTCLAPCTLPMIPLVLGTSTGGGRGRPVGIVLGLAISFTLFSVILAATFNALGVTTSALRLLAVVVLAAVGLSLLVPALGTRLAVALAPLARLGRRLQGRTAQTGLTGGLGLGAALGLVWAPCTGPIMATVLVLANTRGATLETAAVALAYALGAGVPLLAIGYGGRALARRTGTFFHGARLQRGFGGLVLLTSLAILFNWDLRAQDVVASALPPEWTAALYSIEQQAPVQRALRSLQAPPVLAARPVSTATPTPAPAADPALPPPVARHLPASVPLAPLGPAPELTGITTWINAAPLTLRALRGQVVLVHFWTFACINCIHVQPYVQAWYARYKDAGFVVLGVHTPELSFEKEIANVRDAVQKDGVTFPVAFDPQYATWNAYHNGYWPAFYYVDKTGQIRYTHVGEGDYDGQEQVIRQLLQEPTP